MIIKYEENPLDMMIRQGKWQKDLSYFHHHDKIEIIFCKGAPFGALIDGVRYEVKKGDIVVIGEQKIHNFYIYEDDTPYLLCQFPLSILLNNGIIPKPIKPVITKEALSSILNLSSHIESIISVLFSYGNVATGSKSPLAENLYSALYFLLMKHFEEEEASIVPGCEKADFYRILKYANDNFTGDLTISSMAAALFMDRGRLSKIFYKYSGMKLNAYINDLRMAMALSLIKEGMSISRAALDSGFQSVRTFNNVYKSIKQKPTETKK